MRSGLIKKFGLSACATVVAYLLVEGLVRIYFAASGAPLYVAFGARDQAYLERWVELHQQMPGGGAGQPLIYGMGQYHERLGWTPKPNLDKIRLKYHPPVSTNSKGLRSLREIPYSKPAGKRRLVAIGDSYTFGFDGEDEEIWPVLLEETLVGWDVVNLGVFAYGIDQQLIMLQEEGVRYEPDIVVAGVFEDDANRNMLAFRDFAKPRFELVEDELVLTNVPVPTPDEILSRHQHRAPTSYAVHWLRQRLRRRSGMRDLSSTEYTSQRSVLNRAILRQMQREVDGRGAKMLVLFIPDKAERAIARILIRDELSAWSTELGYAFLDLHPIFEASSRQESRSAFSGHLNPLGNVIVTRALAQKLSELGWVEPPSAAALAALERRRERALGSRLSTAKDFISQAYLMQGQGRYKEAERLYREAARLQPNEANTHNNLGMVLALQARFEEACDAYRRALQLEPGYAEAYNNLGGALMELGHTAEAIAHYQKAIRFKADYPAAMVNLGQALVKQDRLDEALEQARQAVQMAPEFAAGHCLVALILASTGQSEEAVETYRRAIRFDPDDADARLKLGIILAGRGDQREAVDNFTEALRINPRFGIAHYNLGVALGELQRFEEAFSHFDAALQMQPKLGAVHYARAVMYYRSGKFDAAWDAVRTFRQAGGQPDPTFLHSLRQAAEEPVCD